MAFYYIVRSDENMEIREKSKTSYDSWITPPSLDSLKHMFKDENKCYGSCSPVELNENVIEQLMKKEPLISQLSEETLLKLKCAIGSEYYGKNSLDLAQDGDGMLIPTFAQIMNEFYLGIKAWDKESEIKTAADKAFYAKYHWTFDLIIQIGVDRHLRNKAS